MTDKLVEEIARAIHADRQRHGLSGAAAWEFEPASIQELYRSNAQAAATISNKRIAELEEALAKVRRYALAGEGPTFDLILAASDAALNTKETDRGE